MFFISLQSSISLYSVFFFSDENLWVIKKWCCSSSLLVEKSFRGLVNSFLTTGTLLNPKISILEITFLVEKIVILPFAHLSFTFSMEDQIKLYLILCLSVTTFSRKLFIVPFQRIDTIHQRTEWKKVT